MALIKQITITKSSGLKYKLLKVINRCHTMATCVEVFSVHGAVSTITKSYVVAGKTWSCVLLARYLCSNSLGFSPHRHQTLKGPHFQRKTNNLHWLISGEEYRRVGTVLGGSWACWWVDQWKEVETGGLNFTQWWDLLVFMLFKNWNKYCQK